MGIMKIRFAVKKNNLVNLKKALNFFKTGTRKAYDLNQIFKKNGRSLLHIAAQHGSDTVFLYLLEQGANINIADHRGDTPAHYATLYGQPKILKLLKEKRADFSRKNNFGDTFEQYIKYKPIKEENKRIKKELEKIILQESNKFGILPMFSNNILLPLTTENYRRQSEYKMLEMFARVMPADVAMKKPEELDNNSLEIKIRQQEEIVSNKKIEISKPSFFKKLPREIVCQAEPFNLIIHDRPLNLSVTSCFKN